MILLNQYHIFELFYKITLESHVSCHEHEQESNKQLCNRIEIKLNQLNQIGLNLRKENNGYSFFKFYFIALE